MMLTNDQVQLASLLVAISAFIFPIFSLACQVLLLGAIALLMPLEFWTPPPSSSTTSRGGVSLKGQTDKPKDVVVEIPLSPQELEATVAASRIVAKEREKFLAQSKGQVPMASSQVQKFCAEAMSVFERNLNPDFSSENQPWKLEYENAARKLKIFSATYPGYACRRWKIVCPLESDLESAYDSIFVPEKRRKWDALVKNLTILQIHDCDKSVGDGLAVSSIVTNAILVVSSRSMLDLALQRCHPRGGILIANASVPNHFKEEQLLDPNEKGTVRARTLIGSGALIRPMKDQVGVLEYVLVSTIDLGGWLPAHLINATMSTSLAQSTEQMQDFVKSKL